MRTWRWCRPNDDVEPLPMTQQPEVSVIVAAYNCMPYVERTIESILSQTIGLERMQVILVDDGSTDGTETTLDRAAATHPNITVIHQENSGGPAAPRNRALELVQGRYIFFLDADDYLCDDALEDMVRVADENGTDVVLSRIGGVGGRNTPRAVFARTLPRTDAFSSEAYWLLNPMKLYRTELVRSLGLRFELDLPVGEDVPFTVNAYLKGNGISILADKVYVFWVHRADLSNLTTRPESLADRMPIVDRIFDRVAAMVPAGRGRDRLMRRHFRVEMFAAFQGYRAEDDPGTREVAFARFRELIAAYATPDAEGGLPPDQRVLMWLISEDRREAFLEYLNILARSERPEVLIEGDRVFLELPGFRDASQAIPEELFELGGSLKVFCRLDPLTVDDSGLHIAVSSRFGVLSDRVTSADLVARPRGGGKDVLFPLAHTIELEEHLPYCAIEEVLPSAQLLGALTDGMYDLHLRLTAGQVSRERRLCECAPAPAESRIVSSPRRRAFSRSATIKTTMYDNLSLRVTRNIPAPLARLIRFARAIARLVRRA